MSILKKIFKNEDKATAKTAKAVKADCFASLATSKQPKAEAEVLTKKPQNRKREDIESYKWLLKPLITEKATDLTLLNKYVFVVPKSAEKIHVKQKIENVYGMKPLKINFIQVTGKKSKMGKTRGKRKDYKKAIATMAAGDKLEIYEGV